MMGLSCREAGPQTPVEARDKDDGVGQELISVSLEGPSTTAGVEEFWQVLNFRTSEIAGNSCFDGLPIYWCDVMTEVSRYA